MAEFHRWWLSNIPLKLIPWKESYDQPRRHIKKKRHYSANKGWSSQGYGFSSGHVWMWDLDFEESWAPKNWCFWTVVLEKTLENPWTARSFNQSILKETSPGCSVEGMRLKLKLQYLASSCEELTHWKRPWCWEGLGAGGEGDDRGWDGWILPPTRWTWVWVNSGVDDGQGGLACCNSWGCKESDTTEKLNWTEYSTVCIYNFFFVQSTADGHLSCFYILSIANKATINIRARVSFWISVVTSLGYIFRSGNVQSYGSLSFSFLRNLHSVFHGGYIFYQ